MPSSISRKTLLPSLLVPLLSVLGCDQTEPASPAGGTVGSAPAGPDGIQLAYAKNGDRIRLQGKVASRTPGAFLLDYGTGSVIVDTSEPADSAELTSLQEGDSVTVLGLVNETPAGQTITATAVAAD